MQKQNSDRMPRSILNLAKFKTLVHLILSSFAPARLDFLKLNLLLWFSDRWAFIRLGQTISGETYLRMPCGPVSRSLNFVVACLKEEGVLSVSLQKNSPAQLCANAEASPDLSKLSPKELEIVDGQLKKLGPLSTNELSALSKDYSWRMFSDGEEFDILAVLARPGQITPEMLEWANSVASKL